MISESPFTAIFGATPAGGGDDPLLPLVRAAVRSGYAVVPCYPQTKRPMCTLNSREVKDADAAAQEAAREDGLPNWERRRHACGINEAITDVKTADKVIKRIEKNGDKPNIGIELGRTRVTDPFGTRFGLLVVDVDTADEVAAFRARWEAETPGVPFPPMTVSSPGVEGVHADGGHFYFWVPEETADLFNSYSTGNLTVRDDNGGTFSVSWKDRQVLVPPSARKEGPYRLVGDAMPLPTWLELLVQDRAAAVTRRRSEQLRQAEEHRRDGIIKPEDAWSAQRTWADLLVPRGWVETGQRDGCDCPTFTAPPVEDHANPKSATGHQPGCSDPHYDTSRGHGPLHLWTDHPPEYLADLPRSSSGKTCSMVQFETAVRHGRHDRESEAKTYRELGIPRERRLSSLENYVPEETLVAQTNGATAPPPPAPPAPPAMPGPIAPVETTDPLSYGESAVEAEPPAPTPAVATDSGLPPLTPLAPPAETSGHEQTDSPEADPEPQGLSEGAASFVSEWKSWAAEVPADLPSDVRDQMLAKLEDQFLWEQSKRIASAQRARSDDDAPPGASWKRQDPGPFLRGEITETETSVGMVRSDGLALLYAGKEHAISGEMESGKSWVALSCAAVEMRKGRHVGYFHFEENDGTGSFERLLLLGATPEEITNQFHFYGPEEPISPAYTQELRELEPSLVVVDGVNEAMSLHEQKMNDMDGTAMLRKMLIKPFTRLGAAVLSCDHVVKDAASRGRYRIGSVHKDNALDGASIMLESVDPIVRGARGSSRLLVAKDRPGYLKPRGQREESKSNMYTIGSLVVDSSEMAAAMTGRPLVAFRDLHRGSGKMEETLGVAEPEVAQTERMVLKSDCGDLKYLEEVLRVYRELYMDSPVDGYTRPQLMSEMKTRLGVKEWTESNRRSVKRANDRLRARGWIMPLGGHLADDRLDRTQNTPHRAWDGDRDGERRALEPFDEKKSATE